jgi:hypothetical protein
VRSKDCLGVRVGCPSLFAVLCGWRERRKGASI